MADTIEERMIAVEIVQEQHGEAIAVIKEKIGIGDRKIESEFLSTKAFEKWEKDILMPEVRTIRKFVGQIKNWIYILISAILLLGFFISIGVLKVSL